MIEKEKHLLKMDEKGRITLPFKLREKLNAKYFVLIYENGGFLLKPIPESLIDDLLKKSEEK